MLEYAEQPDRFLYGSDWPLALMARRIADSPLCRWTIPRSGQSEPTTPRAIPPG
ncbi:MAG: hypothetical protein LM549_08610 [Candidatus Competibacter sp.]|nr:hypothetical protein [Candidatus Competibacter sp.]